MTTTEEKEICCCVSRGWVNVIAWFQIVVCAIGVAGYIFLLIAISTVEPAKDEKAVDAGKELAIGLFVVLLLICVLDLLLGVVLLVGNKKEKTSYIWAWLILTAISIAISIIADIIKAANGTPVQLVSAVITCAIGGFILYVVHRRVREITSRQQQSPPGKV